MSNVAYRIPRDSLIEANQSGLIAETLIDITPNLPILPSKVSLLGPPARYGGDPAPAPHMGRSYTPPFLLQWQFGPLEHGCEEEGLIICDRSRVVGKTGVSGSVGLTSPHPPEARRGVVLRAIACVAHRQAWLI